MKRCSWVVESSEIYKDYHDKEWGIPVYDDRLLFEMLVLECFQSGMNWLTILKRRENFRKAFDNFDVEKVSKYDMNKIDELLNDSGIIRNKYKIAYTTNNAKVFIDIQKEFGSFSNYIWSFTGGKVIKNTEGKIYTRTNLSDRVAVDLKKRGMKLLGSITVYAYLQAIGIVDDHEKECFRY